MDDPLPETEMEKRYRMVCDALNDQIGGIMRSVRAASRIEGRLEDNAGDILCDLAEIQGILYKVCSAGVKKNRDEYLDIVMGSFKEIRK